MNDCGRDDHGLSAAQIEYLLRAVQQFRVGKNGKGFSHLEQQDVRAHLTRIFGFGNWSGDCTHMECVFESGSADDKPRWTVCYRARYELTVKAPCGCALATYGEWASDEATNQPSRGDAHDLAMKSAESQAMKRCATCLGDQFGLSLYNKGSVEGFVKFTLVRPIVEESAQPETPDPPAPTAESLERADSMPARDGITTNGKRDISDPNATVSAAEVVAAFSTVTPEAQDLWDRVEAMRDATPAARMAELAKVQTEASRSKLRNSLVEVGGEVTSLGLALDHATKAAVA